MKSKIFYHKSIKLTYINKKRLARYNRKKYILEFPLSPRLERFESSYRVGFNLRTFEYNHIKDILKDFNGEIYFTILTNDIRGKLFGIGVKKLVRPKYNRTYSWFWSNNYAPINCFIIFNNETDRNLFRLSL